MNELPTRTVQLLVWWVLWASFQIGICFLFYFLGTPGRAVTQPDMGPWLFGLIPLLLSMILRWQVLPRMNTPQKALPVFLIGLALAEASCMLGIFLFPNHKTELFIFAALGIFQHIPVFARRLVDNPDAE